MILLLNSCMILGAWDGVFGGRDARTFEWSERWIHDLKLSFFQTLFEWTNALGVFHFISFSDLIDRCTFHAS